jgi:hypothetical protein
MAAFRDACESVNTTLWFDAQLLPLMHTNPCLVAAVGWSSGGLVVWSSGRLVVWSSGRLVVWSSACVSQDWDKVAYDLQALGFIPEGVADEVLQEMAGPLGRILSQLSGGGGATKLNIDAGVSHGPRWLLRSLMSAVQYIHRRVHSYHTPYSKHRGVVCHHRLCWTELANTTLSLISVPWLQCGT